MTTDIYNLPLLSEFSIGSQTTRKAREILLKFFVEFEMGWYRTPNVTLPRYNARYAAYSPTARKWYILLVWEDNDTMYAYEQDYVVEVIEFN